MSRKDYKVQSIVLNKLASVYLIIKNLPSLQREAEVRLHGARE